MDALLHDVKSLLKDSIYVKELNLPRLEDQYHYHNAYEIAYILRSNGRRVIGDNIEDFTDGDLILIGPHVPHISYSNNHNRLDQASPKVHALVVYFYPDWLTESQLNSAELFKVRELLQNMNRGIKILGQTKKEVVRSILKLKDSHGLRKIITILEILEVISKSGEYVCLASECYSNSCISKDLKRIDAVYQYVQDHYSEKITLKKIASIANMTPTAFCKYFKNHTKKTFSSFVNEMRIGYACKLLCKDQMSISQICYECGYNNLTNFNRNFKYFTKMAPSEYKMFLRE